MFISLYTIIPLVRLSVKAKRDSTWIGQQVVTKYKYPVTIGDHVVDDGSRHQTYTVELVEGDWLWVVSGSIEGWLPVSRVIPVDQALAFYTNEIRSNPGNSGAYNGRGITWEDKKQYEVALADFNEAIRLAPSDSVAYSNRSRIWGLKKDYQKALADCDEAIRLDPRFTEAYQKRGWVWEQTKDFDRAIADYNEAIRLDPQFASAYNGRAWIWATCYDAKFRDCKRAVESARCACNLTEWKDTAFVDTLAAAYAEAGDFDKAVKWQRKANKQFANEDERKAGEQHLKLYQVKKPFRVTD